MKERARSVLSWGPAAGALRTMCSSDRLPRQWRRTLYFRVAKKARQDPDRVFDHQVRGTTVGFHLHGTLRQLFWTGMFEEEALPLFTRYASTADAIVDVGAAEGVYTLFAAAASPTALVVAAEPGSAQLARLRANIDLNQRLTAGRVTVLPVALSDHEGTAEFFELPGGTSSLNPEFRRDTTARTVEVGRGDDLLPELLGDRSLDLVKVDTESTEPEVLIGMEGLLAEHRPVIFCEVLAGRTEPRLQPLVDRLGYRTWWLPHEGAPQRRDRIVGVTGQVNWLFLPDDRSPLPA